MKSMHTTSLSDFATVRTCELRKSPSPRRGGHSSFGSITLGLFHFSNGFGSMFSAFPTFVVSLKLKCVSLTDRANTWLSRVRRNRSPNLSVPPVFNFKVCEFDRFYNVIVERKPESEFGTLLLRIKSPDVESNNVLPPMFRAVV